MRAFLPARWDMFGCFWNALFPNHIHITSEESGTVADTARSALDMPRQAYLSLAWRTLIHKRSKGLVPNGNRGCTVPATVPPQ